MAGLQDPFCPVGVRDGDAFENDSDMAKYYDYYRLTICLDNPVGNQAIAQTYEYFKNKSPLTKDDMGEMASVLESLPYFRELTYSQQKSAQALADLYRLNVRNVYKSLEYDGFKVYLEEGLRLIGPESFSELR